MLARPDGKEYDVYVSYARNAEEEEFVLLTLRGVLENEFGYKLCIFDRDSLPGGSEYLTGGCALCMSSVLLCEVLIIDCNEPIQTMFCFFPCRC